MYLMFGHMIQTAELIILMVTVRLSIALKLKLHHLAVFPHKHLNIGKIHDPTINKLFCIYNTMVSGR